MLTSSTSGTSFGIPLWSAAGKGGETLPFGGEGRKGSQGLGTRGLSDSCSPNMTVAVVLFVSVLLDGRFAKVLEEV